MSNAAQMAEIVKVVAVDKHPNADKLDVLTLLHGGGHNIQLVTGPHYRTGQFGVWIHPGTRIPGYLAKDLWLSAKGKDWFDVRDMEIRGVRSRGLFCGDSWQDDRDSPWQPWPMWQKHWKLGMPVANFLGVIEVKTSVTTYIEGTA